MFWVVGGVVWFGVLEVVVYWGWGFVFVFGYYLWRKGIDYGSDLLGEGRFGFF